MTTMTRSLPGTVRPPNRAASGRGRKRRHAAVRGRPGASTPGQPAPVLAWAPALLLVAATVLAYVPALEAGFVWDDDDYVTANPTLRSVHGLWRIWSEPGAVPQYYPLTFTSLWLDQRLFGLEPLGYHLVNVLLHAVNGLLLWRILRLLAVPGAWLAAAIFVLHPVHVESVAWVTERKNVLSGAFCLASLWAYLRWTGLGAAAAPVRAGLGMYGLAAAPFLCALLSKTVTCTLPAVILLLIWWRRGRIGGGDVAAVVPFGLVGAAFALLTVWTETHHVGAVGADWELSFVDRCLIAGRALWFYAAKLLWPARLTFFYPRWEIDAGAWWQYLFPLAAAAVPAILWWLRPRLGTGPLVAVLVYAVTLLPALGFVDVFPMRYSFVADHFQYLASVGLIALAAAAAARVLPAMALRTGSVVVLVALGALSWRQAGVYEDLRALWEDTIAKNPRAWMAHNNLGLLLEHEGRLEDAVVHYRAALAIKPDDDYAHNNLGNVRAAQGRLEEAAAHFGEAIRLGPTNAEAHNNLGNLLAGQGRFEEAVAQYREAMRKRPRYPEAHNNIGNVFALQGRPVDARAEFEAALRIEPDYAEAHHNLGLLLAGERQLDAAAAHYREALRSKPGYVPSLYRLGEVLALRGELREAAAAYAEVVRLAPDDADARTRLGAVLMGQGRVDEAIAQLDAALRVDPGHAEAERLLAVARAERERAGSPR